MPTEVTMHSKTQIEAAAELPHIDWEVSQKILSCLKEDFRHQRRHFPPGREGYKEYKKALAVIANHIYLIYEYLYLKVAREIDYTDIKNFAIKNNDVVKYVLKRKFPEFSMEALDSWTQIHIDLLECAMFRSSNKYNKHIYH